MSKWEKCHSICAFSLGWWHPEISFIQCQVVFNAVWHLTCFSWWGGCCCHLVLYWRPIRKTKPLTGVRVISRSNWEKANSIGKIFSNTRLGFDRPLTCVIQVLVFRLSKPPTKPPWLPLGFYFFSSQGFCHCTLKCHSKFVTETSITLSVTLLKSKHFWQTKRFQRRESEKRFQFCKSKLLTNFIETYSLQEFDIWNFWRCKYSVWHQTWLLFTMLNVNYFNFGFMIPHLVATK